VLKIPWDLDRDLARLVKAELTYQRFNQVNAEGRIKRILYSTDGASFFFEVFDQAVLFIH